MGMPESVPWRCGVGHHPTDYGSEPRWLRLASAVGPPAGIAVVLVYVGSGSGDFGRFENLVGIVLTLTFLATVLIAPWLVWLAKRDRRGN